MTDEPAISIRDAIAIGLAAILLRAAICVTILFTRHISLDQYARNGDGASYLAMARAMLGDSSALTDYDRRVFPGYPGMIALVGLARVPLPVAALAIDWTCAGAAAGLAAMLFSDRRVGLAMVALIPQYVINSSMAMSEAPLLALSLAGIWLTLRATGWRTITGGFVLGLAGLVRPMACFAAGGCLIALWVREERRRAAIVGIAAGMAAIAGVIAMQAWTGDVLRGVRIYKNSPQAYTGHLFAWPFESLIRTPFREWGTVEGWSIPYIWAHVAIVGMACGVLVKRWGVGKHGTRLATRLSSSKSGEAAKCGKSRLDDRDALAMPWAVGNLLFVLCIGSSWGFRHFPRFNIPALPALFWGLRAWLPRSPWAWVAIGIFGFVIGVAGVAHSL